MLMKAFWFQIKNKNYNLLYIKFPTKQKKKKYYRDFLRHLYKCHLSNNLKMFTDVFNIVMLTWSLN